MATIALYAGKVNQMHGLIMDVKTSVTDYKDELTVLKMKALTINQSVCNMDDIIKSIQSSSQTQERKTISLDTIDRNNGEFVDDVISIDSDVASIVRQRKADFYKKYTYLKPECEKNGLEKFTDSLKKTGEWCKEHWKLVVTVVITIVAIALIWTGIGGIIGAMAVGALLGAGIGGILGGTISAITGGSFWKGLEDGAFSGAIAGLISGGMGFQLSAAGKQALTLGKELFIGGVTGAGTSLIGDLGEKCIKGADISLGQILGNMAFSGVLGTIFAGIGYGISKTFSNLLKNSSWFSKELFRIGETANPSYGRVTSYTTVKPNGISVNLANNAGKTIIRFEFDAAHYLHYHMPDMFHTASHIPFAPIIESVLSRILKIFTQNGY